MSYSGQLVSECWQKTRSSKHREIELISRKIWRKRKKKMFRSRSWLLLNVKQHKKYFWRTFVIRKCIYLHSTGWWFDDEVAMYLLTYRQQTNLSQQTNEQTKVIKEVVSPKVSKLNHTVMNKKHKERVFSRERRLEQRKWIHPTHHNSLWIVL